ncbi:MAG: hypothetical protein IJ112_04735, partial [Oscillospiraceae bacterium]|nr:hypothetical protein [Oscillospiraceae bacterium]
LRYTGSALMTVFFSQHLQLNAKRSTSQVLLDLTGAFSVARYFATRPSCSMGDADRKACKIFCSPA